MGLEARRPKLAPTIFAAGDGIRVTGSKNLGGQLKGDYLPQES